jgi:hypothetical protein
MAITRKFRFEECSCIDVSRSRVTIPSGIWPVLERNVVSIIADRRFLDLPNAAFELLKSERKALPVD